MDFTTSGDLSFPHLTDAAMETDTVVGQAAATHRRLLCCEHHHQRWDLPFLSGANAPDAHVLLPSARSNQLHVVGPGPECLPSTTVDPPDIASLQRTSDGPLRRPTDDSSSAPAPAPGTPISTTWSPLAGGWDSASLTAAFSTMAMTPPHPLRLGGQLRCILPHQPHCRYALSLPSHPLLHPSSIIVGNGSTLSVTFVGASVLPGSFYLNDVIVAPHITHNLLSVRRFTTDNSRSIEFDPSGFSVKDLATKTPLARCDSSGPLYTLRSSSTSASPPPVLVSTTSSTTWHRHLGHPGPDVMTKLTSSLDL
jgi:hypothetical protein